MGIARLQRSHLRRLLRLHTALAQKGMLRSGDNLQHNKYRKTTTKHSKITGMTMYKCRNPNPSTYPS